MSNRILIWVLILNGICACGMEKKPSPEQVRQIDSIVNNRLDKYKRNILEDNCQKRAALDAQRLAAPVLDSLDSIQTVHLQLQLRRSYDFVGDFTRQQACVCKGNEWGVVDKKGKLIVPLTADGRKYQLKSGLARIKRCDFYGFVDKDGKMVIPPIYDLASNFTNGLATVKRKRKFGLINERGATVIPFQYDSLSIEGEKYLKAYKNGKYGILTLNGSLRIPIEYDAISLLYKAFKVEKDRKTGVIDEMGKALTELKYDDVKDFIEGRAMVRLHEQYGFIDEKGKEIVATKYDDAQDFRGGRAVVVLNDKFGYIDRTGKEIIPLEYEEAHQINEKGLLKVRKDGKDLFLDINGKPAN